jgi:hypothetical protein
MRWLMIEGTLDFGDVQIETLLAHLSDRLRDVEARRITISDNSVSFRGGLFRFAGRWNVLVPFGYGELVTDPEKRRVHYRLSIRELVVAVTTMMVLVAIGAWVLIQESPGIVLFFALGWLWLWLVGGNLLFGIPRFKRFLREAVDSTPVRRPAGER